MAASRKDCPIHDELSTMVLDLWRRLLRGGPVERDIIVGGSFVGVSREVVAM